MSHFNIPQTQLKPGYPISDRFIAKNLVSFDECIHYIHQLPYGRNKQRDQYYLVLSEGKGTCSTKHALIKALADEQNIPLSLILGLLITTTKQDPRISKMLKKHNLPGIPEAHCILKYNSIYFDITFPGELLSVKPHEIVQEFSIIPDQIGSFKLEKHHDFIERWINEQNIPYSKSQIWEIRESWIKFLSNIAP